MFNLETDILRVAVLTAVSEVYNGDDEITELNLRLTATEMMAEVGTAYVVRTKYAQTTSFNVYAYFSDADLATDGADSIKVFEITKLDYGYKVADVDFLFI